MIQSDNVRVVVDPPLFSMLGIYHNFCIYYIFIQPFIIESWINTQWLHSSEGRGMIRCVAMGWKIAQRHDINAAAAVVCRREMTREWKCENKSCCCCFFSVWLLFSRRNPDFPWCDDDNVPTFFHLTFHSFCIISSSTLSLFSRTGATQNSL